MTFNMDDYVDVAERIGQFKGKHPEGSLQSELSPVHDATGNLVGWLAKAWAYRDQDDRKPGVGHAVEPVPGKTPYTRDSEAMNAETSAWGRAIIALGFPTKKIASANEVRARVEEESPPKVSVPRGFAPGAPQPDVIAKAQAAQEANKKVPPDGGDAEAVVLTFGQHKGENITDVPRGYLEWMVEKMDPKTEMQRRAQAAAALMLNVPPQDAFPVLDDDLPF